MHFGGEHGDGWMMDAEIERERERREGNVRSTQERLTVIFALNQFAKRGNAPLDLANVAVAQISRCLAYCCAEAKLGETVGATHLYSFLLMLLTKRNSAVACRTTLRLS